MKIKLISILLAICMVLTIFPVSGYAAFEDVSQHAALSERKQSTKSASGETAAETAKVDTAPDEALSDVQAMIDALLSAAELSAMDETSFSTAGEQLHAA